MPVSTATPEKLPDIKTLRRLTQSIAMLDAIISPEWEFRFYSYNSQWAPNEEMASMRNGCGDEWFLLFDSHGAALKGHAHEYPLAGASFAKRIQEVVPAVFTSFLNEPAFSMDYASFCLWRAHSDAHWNVVTPVGKAASPEQDGSGFIMDILDGDPRTYQAFALDYYAKEISLTTIQAIYAHQPLNDDLISMLNPGCVLADIGSDAATIGYPDGKQG